MSRKVALITGGTGGHVIPAVILGKGLEESLFDVIYLGMGLSSNKNFVEVNKEYHDLDSSNLSEGICKGFSRICRGFFRAKKILEERQVDYAIGFGSYHGAPGMLAALMLGIPYSLVELNAEPGVTNQMLARFADRLLIQFPSAGNMFLKYHSKCSVSQFSSDSFSKVSNINKDEAKGYFGFSCDLPVILVFGGSQGAKNINVSFARSLDHLNDAEVQVIHITGSDVESYEKIYEDRGIKAVVKSFSTDMDMLWSACDMAICRAGGGAIREAITYEKPLVLVPLPSAKNDHQTKNAKFFVSEVGGGIIFKEISNSKKFLAPAINSILRNLNDITEKIRGYKKKTALKSALELVSELL